MYVLQDCLRIVKSLLQHSMIQWYSSPIQVVLQSEHRLLYRGILLRLPISTGRLCADIRIFVKALRCSTFVITVRYFSKVLFLFTHLYISSLPLDAIIDKCISVHKLLSLNLSF